MCIIKDCINHIKYEEIITGSTVHISKYRMKYRYVYSADNFHRKFGKFGPYLHCNVIFP